MTISEEMLFEAIKDIPLGETENFIWFITDIGILALVKDEEKINKNPEKESLEINLDLTKEEKEYYVINKKQLILFYS
tara:strand:+ start:28 stop:261 length:234 start_codon:yes stop_codon:yes gene_type:complete